jgi:hypothetical protein
MNVAFIIVALLIFIGYGWGVLFPVNSSEKILLNREIVNRRGSWRFAMDQILQKNNLELQIKREAIPISLSPLISATLKGY